MHRWWKSDTFLVFLFATAVMALTLTPYVYAARLTGSCPSKGWYSWFLGNVVDPQVYLSWMRQAAEGHLFLRNLFTNRPQSGLEINLLFLLVGTLARLFRLKLIFVYHAARIGLGIAFFAVLWWLLKLWLPDRRLRWLSLVFVAFSAGLGWLALPPFCLPFAARSVDTWQTEAISLQSLYFSPLFSASLLLMAGTLGLLWVAERDRSRRAEIGAGLCALVLGNIHSYDVLTLAFVWTVYLLVKTVRDRQWHGDSWRRALLAGAIASPAILYMYLLSRLDPVMIVRSQINMTSLPIGNYLLGYGLLIPLAAFGAWHYLARTTTEPNEGSPSRDVVLFLSVWTIANLLVAYAPVPFQRRLIMGEHIPLSILAAMGTMALLRPAIPEVRFAGVATLIALLSLTNIVVLVRDARSAQGENRNTGYLYAGEVKALEWLQTHIGEDTVIQPLPWVHYRANKIEITDATLAGLTPALTGRAVNAGHGGETPYYQYAIISWSCFFDPALTDERRRQILQGAKVAYLIFSQKHPGASDRSLATFASTALRRLCSPDPSLPRLEFIPQASNQDADVYRVLFPLTSSGLRPWRLRQ